MKESFAFLIVGIVVGLALSIAVQALVFPEPEPRVETEIVWRDSDPLPPVVVTVPSKPVVDSAAVVLARAQADSALAEATSARELVAELMLRQAASKPFKAEGDSVTVEGVIRGEYIPPLRQMLLGVEVTSVRYPEVKTTITQLPPQWAAPTIGIAALAAGILVSKERYWEAAACVGLSITVYEVYL